MVAVDSVTVRVAKRLFGWIGEAVMFTPQVPFGARVVQPETVVKSEGLGPLSAGALKVIGRVPVLTMPTLVAVDVWPIWMLPRSTELGVREKCNPGDSPTPMRPAYGVPFT